MAMVLRYRGFVTVEIYLNILFIISYLHGGLINRCMEALQLVREPLILKKDKQEWIRAQEWSAPSQGHSLFLKTIGML